ncbi:MAG: DUF721 domain-containing protein [Verrucomicrobiae bacterium]|nr:DUF721 domain-containing protein [Verrucomicrobiae bacterium]MCX7915885.1 DUF721 domain-containing protein [Verrucomicrobiae bacterium]MDW8343486.1 DUF721 domain-containing protein [Verrucomicrobiae bacterium]
MTPSLRRLALRELRPYADLDTVDNLRAGRHVGEVIPELVARLGLRERLQRGQVFDRWEQLVGSFIAKLARPVALRDGRLTVAVDHPAYIQELRPHSDLIIQKIAQGVGPNIVREIRWRVG